MNDSQIFPNRFFTPNDTVHWLDGSSAETTDNMQRISVPLRIDLHDAPRDLGMINTLGKTAFLRRPNSALTELTEHPSPGKTLPAQTITGTVSDPSGLYIARKFTLQIGQGISHSVVLYPTPLGAGFSQNGGLLGAVRQSHNQAPLPWALLTLKVWLDDDRSIVVRGQTNAQGDFSLPTHTLPALPEGKTHYNASLSLAGQARARSDSPLDPAGFSAFQLGALNTPEFCNNLALNIIPGQLLMLRSYKKDHLAVQTE
ncbi:MAG TPA: hypothetical protein VFM46_18730 [Pseudomonadales bacterium]|nr:hypothetical protein [Pseudomonadales bacterium]